MDDYIPITLVKEYAYCPRIFYYKYFMLNEPLTESMKYPKYTYQEIVALIRSHKIDGEVIMEYPVKSKKLGIIGKIDTIIIHDNRTFSIIEVKTQASKKKLETTHKHIKTQIIAYTIAAEETLHKRINKTYILSLENKKLIEIKIKPWERTELENLTKEIRKILKNQKPPQKTPNKNKCKTCFYKKYCPKT